jgi:uncharacterized protein
MVVRARWVRLVAFALVSCTLTFFLSLASSAAYHWTHPARIPTDVTPTVMGLPYEDVSLVTEDGLRLAAWYVPTHNGAAIVMVHGLGTNRTTTLGLTKDLADRGYGLLLLDLRAHGDSEGTVSTLGIHEVRDVRSGVRYLQSRPEVDARRIGIFGGSLGGSVAIMSAAEIPELQAVVVDSTFSSIEWVVEHQFEKLDRVPKWLAPLVVALGGWHAGVDAAEIAPIRHVAEISPRPLLIIHGAEDETFLVENATLLAQAAGPPTELWIIPSVGHTAGYAADPVGYAERILQFFDQALVSAEPSASQ